MKQSDFGRRMLANPYNVNSTDYELWCEGCGDWSLVLDGKDIDTSILDQLQLDRICWDVFELRQAAKER